MLCDFPNAVKFSVSCGTGKRGRLSNPSKLALSCEPAMSPVETSVALTEVNSSHL